VIYGTFREILGDEDGKDKIVAPHFFNLCTKWKYGIQQNAHQ